MDSTASDGPDVQPDARRGGGLDAWLATDESEMAWVDARVVLAGPDGEEEKPFGLGLTERRLVTVDRSDPAEERLDASIPLEYILSTWLEDFGESTDLVVRLTTGAYVRFEVAHGDRVAAAEFCKCAAELADAGRGPDASLDESGGSAGEEAGGEDGLEAGGHKTGESGPNRNGAAKVLVGARAAVPGAASAVSVGADGASEGYFVRVEMPDPPPEKLVLCRHCGRRVRSDAVFCGWCGTTV
jgi:hypothetical protein